MTNDHIEGVARSGLGRLQDGVGGLAGDARLQAKGKVNEAAGRVQSAFGKVKDSASDSYDMARSRAGDIYGGFDRTLRQQPIIGIGVGLVLGAAIGLLIGEARRER